MSTPDIVEDLRRSTHKVQMCTKAANEIERLREELQFINAHQPAQHDPEEVGRLRAALLSVYEAFQDVDYWEHVSDDANELIESLKRRAFICETCGAGVIVDAAFTRATKCAVCLGQR